jgi:hypothetical protein
MRRGPASTSLISASGSRWAQLYLELARPWSVRRRVAIRVKHHIYSEFMTEKQFTVRAINPQRSSAGTSP